MHLPQPHRMPVISGRTAQHLVDAEDGVLEVSLDLGLSMAGVSIGGAEVVLPDGQRPARAELAASFSSPEDCIEIRPDGCRKVYIYSQAERKYYKLYQPHEGRAPTVVINNAAMHAIVGKDPWQNAAEKVGTLPARRGECLDTCCGLGYSAQLLAQEGFERVVTCEVDPNVLQVAAANPWSEGLFTGRKIEIVQMDVRRFVESCPHGRFACIFHDPPTVLQAGELYAGALYAQFARALSAGGVLYHYVGDPGGRTGRDYARGVMRRLQRTGFTDVRRVVGGLLAARAAAL